MLQEILALWTIECFPNGPVGMELLRNKQSQSLNSGARNMASSSNQDVTYPSDKSLIEEIIAGRHANGEEDDEAGLQEAQPPRLQASRSQTPVNQSVSANAHHRGRTQAPEDVIENRSGTWF